MALITRKIGFATLIVTLVSCCIGLPRSAQADWRDDLGYTDLELAFGGNAPNGAGVNVSMVEAPFGMAAKYLPDEADIEFSDIPGTPKIIDGSPPATNKSPSDHATEEVGHYFFGKDTSIAGGVNQVTAYEVNHYLNNFLPTAATMETPSYVVQNHSWVATLESTSNDLRALRRVDFFIDKFDITSAVGVSPFVFESDNPTVLEPQPPLLAHSYNAIAVGRISGKHSRGETTSLYGPGRTKPDIVVPGNFTISRSTGIVSSAATVLHEIAAGTDATKSEVIKALLLTGATKNEFDNYVDTHGTGDVNPWERSHTQPLDDLAGAGELNIYNSYLAFDGGQAHGDVLQPTAIGSHGWDYQESISADSEIIYEFEVPAGETLVELSVILTWNVDVTSSFNSHSLVNLDLALEDSAGALVDQSISSVDNVEHIYIGTSLTSGVYNLKVLSDLATSADTDFGLAWRSETVATGDFNEDGNINGFDYLIWQRGFGIADAHHSNGDADGDGDVDGDDLIIFQNAMLAQNSVVSSLAVASLTAVTNVPEPATLTSLLTGLFLLMGRNRRRKRSSTAC